MKKIATLTILLCFSTLLMWSQNQNSIPLIGSKAPSFKAESTNGKINFPSDYGKSWKILFSHPQDFTPVCSSELLELAQLQDDFAALDVKLVVLSTDKLSQHVAWKESLESLEYQGRDPKKINFPIVADDNFEISRSYGMLHTPTSSNKDVRGVFVIDPDNVVQAIYFYPMNVGRNIDEVKRTVTALQSAQSNVSIPANWEPGDDVLLTYLTDQEKAEKAKAESNIYEVSWYMIFMRTR